MAKALLIAFVCFLLVLSPLDLIPDVFFPVGFFDDAGYVATGIKAIKNALGTPVSRGQ